MISIVISEKDGAERREVFHQDEITVGRVKGNDVLLAKGNVSKQHARLIVRDGRYIVTDLKSTNGTYVNHRRITHATLVREGDRIYIGDFIIRLASAVEGASGGADTTGVHSHVPDASVFAPDDGTQGSLHDPPTTSGKSLSSLPAQRSSMRAEATRGGHGSTEDIVSHFPLEHDPDADELGGAFDLGGATRGSRTETRASTPSSYADMFDGAPRESTLSSQGSPSSITGADAALSSGVGAPLSSEATPSGRTSQLALEEARRAMQREYVGELVDAVEPQLTTELEELPRPSAETSRRVEMMLEEQVARAAPPEFDIDRLIAAARSELVGLGPIEPLLADDAVHRLRIAQRDVHVQRRGQASGLEGLGFARESSVVRVIRRLCADFGKPVGEGEGVVERDLPDGRKLSALLPPAAIDGAVLQLRRTRSEPTSLNQLVRSGTLSRGMAMLLAQAMAARTNLLVVGPADQGGDDVVSALCLAAPRTHQLLAIGEADHGGRAVRLAARVDDGKLVELVRAATRMAPDHLSCKPLASEALVALLDAIADGQLGVVLANPAGTLRQALDRIAADVAATRAMDVATARDWVSSAFELAIEVGRLRDGRVRVLRIAELKGPAPRDVFTFNFHRTAAGGSVEGSFVASGLIPRVVDDLAARGLPLDTLIFRRHPST